MTRRPTAWNLFRGLLTTAALFALAGPADLLAANKAEHTARKPIKNPKFDPKAEQAELFDAVDDGRVTIRLIPNDALGGTVLIENKTDQPLTVKIPEAMVGISVHAQIGNVGAGNLFGNGAGNNNLFGNGNMIGNGNAAGGGQQMQGGGIGMNGNNGMIGNGAMDPFGPKQNPGGGMPNGNNFFSIPAERVISLTFNSVCLEHGKPEPTPRSKYTLVPVSRVSRDPVLAQLLATVGKGKVDKQAAQAAAWHLANKMSFEELAAKVNAPLPGLPGAPYFSPEQLQVANQLLDQARERADVASKESPTQPAKDTPQVVVSSRTK